MRPFTKKILLLLILFFGLRIISRYVFPLFFPFLLGTALALASEPAVKLLSGRLRMPRPVASGIGVSLTFGGIMLLVLILFALILRELKYLTGVLPELEDTARSGLSLLQTWLLDQTAQLPNRIGTLLQRNITEFFSGGTALLDRGIRYILGLAGTLLTHVPGSALTLGTAVISGYMISAKLPRLRRWIREHLPLSKLQTLLDALKQAKTALGGWLLAQVKLSGVTLLLLAGGLLLLRIPNALLWALAICLLDALPVLGTAVVLLPWSLIRFLQGSAPQAIGLLGLYASITLIRSTLEPKLVGQQLGLDPLVTLMALYIGFKLWGLGGMILAPMLTVTFLQLLPDRKES